MKQQKAMLIALIVICLTVVVRRGNEERPLRVRIRTGQTEVAVFTAYEPEVRDPAGRNPRHL